MRINLVQPERPHITTGHIRFTCHITKTKNSHTEYVSLIVYPQ